MESGAPLLPFKEEVLTYTPWVYLHGELESKSAYFGGWDKLKWFGDAPTTDGIYECRVWMGTDSTNTQILEATAFIWEAKFGVANTKVTGLIILNGDKKSLEFAFNKWQDKSDFF
jgi:hypothetical protein